MRAKGLRNTGVSCHMNALMQMLVTSERLRGVVAAMQADTRLARAVKKFVDDYENGSPDASEVLRELKTDTYGSGQESVTEGFVLMMERLGALRVLFEQVSVVKVHCLGCGASTGGQRDKTLQFNTFGLDALKKYPDTPAAFAAAVACGVAKVDGFRCGECGARGGSAAVHRMVRAPPLFLVVHNKYTEKKARYCPSRFELPAAGGGVLGYERVAQVEHSGGLHGGHYWARVARSEGVVVVNDEAVASAQFADGDSVYAVLYEADVQR